MHFKEKPRSRAAQLLSCVQLTIERFESVQTHKNKILTPYSQYPNILPADVQTSVLRSIIYFHKIETEKATTKQTRIRIACRKLHNKTGKEAEFITYPSPREGRACALHSQPKLIDRLA